MTNIIEKLALASRNARALPGSIAVSPTETDRKIARAVLQTLHDNITPEMALEGTQALYAEGLSDLKDTDAAAAFRRMIATALKGERA